MEEMLWTLLFFCIYLNSIWLTKHMLFWKMLNHDINFIRLFLINQSSSLNKKKGICWKPSMEQSQTW